jgi:hypothetical protein
VTQEQPHLFRVHLRGGGDSFDATALDLCAEVIEVVHADLAALEARGPAITSW